MYSVEVIIIMYTIHIILYYSSMTVETPLRLHTNKKQ